MAKPYSMDLRERVMEAITSGQTRELTIHQFIQTAQSGGNG